ncbi:cation channel family protein, putative [Ichthyophthirius multifiliis]|uniref:Cation channel family protein, putative n=1 Tax=Ichthyophthirius multifiliis TaxID=5932 RepID=G0QW43_ICHMU|nr:cation channel family protein, putative [Ichthyophthirius multifiliis]EGR30563.1 cation channel family protein, putative [Ichthyophthirius multifiliis]|eukprot:XP_004032150.1 cation channel family protein, putative [Ichthyophthirius multifiliis]
MIFIAKYKNIYSLEQKHFKFIRDKSFGGFYERESKQNKIFYYVELVKYIFLDENSPFKTFQPNNLFIITWETILFCFLLFLVFYIPLQVCFSFQNIYIETSTMQNFMKLAPYLLTLDMLININTAYYDKGITINNRQQIIVKYLMFKFWIDIITIVSFIFQSQYKLLFLLRLVQVKHLINKLDENYQIQYKMPITFQLQKLLLVVLLVSHMCACGFHFILKYSTEEQNTWIKNINAENTDWKERYINSLYFSFTTMITVGFGDIVPKNVNEKIYVIIVQVISCGIFAYVVNCIGSIFSDIARKNAEFKQQKYEITDYMLRRNITKDTQMRVIKYLEYIHISSDVGHMKGYNILNLVSKRLRDNIYKEYYGDILQNFKIFSRKFSKDFLKQFSIHIREFTLGPGEVLFNQGELDQRMFFIQNGDIELYIDLQENARQDIILNTLKVFFFLLYIYLYFLFLKSGDYFGQDRFFVHEECKYSARSVNVTQLVFWNFEDFLNIIKQFPNDYVYIQIIIFNILYYFSKKEIFCSFKEKINSKDEMLDINCNSCGKFNHQIINCPLLHYDIDKDVHLKRYMHSIPQERKQNKNQFIQKKYKTLKNYSKIKRKFKLFQKYNKIKEQNQCKLRKLRLKLAE